jgi:hypothetical protein
VLTPKRVVKHEHALMRFTTQQLTLLGVQTILTGRDKRFGRYNDDQRVGVKIKIAITVSW